MASLRNSFVAFAALIAAGACTKVSPEVESEGGIPVSCALQGESEFGTGCRLIEIANGDGSYFVMRHPDGGFRRLAEGETPAGLTEGDGAQEATSQRNGDLVELTVGGDRYRWKVSGNE